MKKKLSRVKTGADLQNILKLIPSVEAVLQNKKTAGLQQSLSQEYLSFIVKKHVDIIRRDILNGKFTKKLSRQEIELTIISKVERELETIEKGTLIPVINATGVVLHTGLGRAPLSPSAVKSVNRVLKDYSILEIERKSGKRGKREGRLEQQLCFLSGSESATVVNNNAAAVLISLNTLAKGKEVIISRGELVEIGGSFRMPEIMEASGAVMKEVGTTNRTKLSDYEKAITPETGAILLVHTSNFKIVGFKESASIKQIVELAGRHSLPVIYDLGGGVLYDLREMGLPHEPVVSEAVKSGVDIATFSGDKVMGGPQSGIIAGKKKYLDDIKKNPLARALRCDKMSLAALEGTLKSYSRGLSGFKSLPAIAILKEPQSSVRKKVEHLLELILNRSSRKLRLSIMESSSEAGSGAMPAAEIPSCSLCLETKKQRADKIAGMLRENNPPVFGYINNDKVYLDLRTVFKRQIPDLARAVDNLIEKL